MAASSHDMRAVELVEDDGVPDVAVPNRGAAPSDHVTLPPPDAAPGRRRRASGAVAVLVIGLVVGDGIGDARARAGLAALADVPGVVAPLDVPLVELWRGDPALRPELGEAGGRLIGVMGAQGAADVVGLDPATGAVVWRTLVREESPGDGGAGVRCVTPDAPARPDPAAVPTVVCVVDRARRGPDARAASADGRSTVPEDRLLTLDARSGAVLAERTVERSTVLDRLGPDVVTGHVDASGHVHVRRTDPLGDQVRWSFVTPRPLPRSHLAWATRIGVEDGVVVVDEADGWVLSADGQVLHSWTGSTREQLAGTAEVVGAGRYLTRPEITGGPWPRSRVTDLRTGRSFVVQGRPVSTWPDDGTTDDLVVVRNGGSEGLVAHEPTGDARWSVGGTVQGRALVVDGRLLRIGATDLSAIDARTGALLWSSPLTRTARNSLLTDGRLAVVSRLDPDDGIVLSAYGLEDGRPRWTVDLADDVGALTDVGHRVFGWTGEQLVALGRPGG